MKIFYFITFQVQILKPQPPKPHVRSKAIQTDIISKTKPKKAVVPPSLTDYLSPEKNMVAPTEAVQDTSFHLSDIEENTSDSGSSDSIDAHLYLSYNLKLMLRKPRYYLGLDLENVKLIDHLSKFGKLKQNSVLLVLRKIRLNEPFHALADLFSSTKSVISRDFNSSLPRIFPLLEVFIFWPSRASIRSNLPLQFQSNFSNVESIIDCFEIQIEKPSKPTLQAITWSNYKTCNTLKFLVSCTPSGLINFISKGYSGRLTDMYIVEDCGYLEKLSAGSVVLADRGFKQLETLLHKKQCSLKRPPSVSAGVKLTKDQVKETKKIASLRVHVERVIKRLREYKFLDAHSRFHHNLLKNIDAVVIIAAALSNCQTPIISES